MVWRCDRRPAPPARRRACAVRYGGAGMAKGDDHRDGNRLEYRHRVNRVIDYIQEHRAEELSLEVLAQVAAFSPYHFHRIFKAMTGENLKELVQRLRLEWAASMLLNRPEREVLDIALDSGFGSASAFARAFKDRFGMTATEWRMGGAAAWSKDRLAV